MVRHGKTPSTGKLLPGRAKGLHLSETGKQEALVVAERLSKIKKVAAIMYGRRNLLKGLPLFSIGIISVS